MAALSERHNIVVICDEAHRSQYGFKGRLDLKTGQRGCRLVPIRETQCWQWL